MAAKILVVDDDPVVIKLIVSILEQNNYKAVTASDGKACLSIARKTKPGLIILDIYMPGMNGFNVCKKLKADPKTSGIPIIMLTASQQERDLCKGLQKGVSSFISKPFISQDLLSEIASALPKK